MDGNYRFYLWLQLLQKCIQLTEAEATFLGQNDVPHKLYLVLPNRLDFNRECIEDIEIA
jgi:hypothetical protein